MKIKYYISLFCVVILFSSCEKQLTLLPEDTLSPETYFSNEKELQLWTNQFYSMLDDADELTGQNSDENVDNGLGALMLGQRDAASENGWNWSELRKINYYLQNSQNTKDQAVRNKYDGVAYFFRAYFYFEKVRRYGDVPWYDQVLNTSDDVLLFKERQDRGIIMDSVMNDLDKAIRLLPAAKDQARITKWTALAFKTRAALYEGTFRKYHGLGNSDKYLNEVISAGDDFIQNGNYSLYSTGSTPYRTLFNSDNAVANEVILTRIYSDAANLRNGIQFNIVNNKQGFTKRFMNYYLNADGSRYTNETDVFATEVVGRDPRLAQTVLTPGYIQTGATAVTVNKMNAVTGYQPIKFVAGTAYDGAAKAVNDYPLFRSAEVLLNYAEAKAELGTLSQADLDLTINKIRTRASMPNLVLANITIDPVLASYYPNVSNNNKAAILEVRRERTVELALEGFRQWDLLRWKEGKQLTEPFLGCYFPGPGRYDMDNNGVDDLVLWTGTSETIAGGTSKQIGRDIILSNGNSGYVVAYPTINITWDEARDYLWPIPTSERVLTRGKLTQNAGWEDSSGF